MCGISMYVGVKPANIDKLKILGIYNITRGSDACGVAINNTIVKGVDDYKANPSIKRANFSNLIEQVNINTKEEDENYTCIIHNRKASTSWTEKNNPNHAHPFLITDQDDNPILIGAHNGSISNCVELKKKYEMKGEYPVDSQLMLSILAKCRNEKNPYEVLKDYKGNAVLTWFYTDEPNTLYVWKGATKLNHNSTEATEERPMYVWEKESNKELYFSSIKEALYAIGGNETNVFSIGSNKVHKFISGKKTRIIEVKREVVENENFTGGSQKRSCSTGTVDSARSNQRSISTSRHATCHNSGNSTPSINTTYSLSTIQKTFVNYPNYKRIEKIASKHGGLKLNREGFTLIEYEPYTFNPAKSKSRVYFYKGRYFQNGHIIGINTPKDVKELTLDYMGYPSDSKVQFDKDSAEKYYFYMGFLLADESAAYKLKDALKKDPFGIMLKEAGVNTSFYMHALCKYCYGFIQNWGDIKGAARSWNVKESVEEYANGEYYPMFDYTKKYMFVEGTFIGSEYDDSTSGTKILVDTLPNNGKMAEIEKKQTNNESVIVLPERTEPVKDTLADEIKEGFTDAVLDFIKDGETIDKEYTTPLHNTEYESLLNAIRQTIKHVKKRKSQLITDDGDELFPVERGILYS